MHLLDCWKSSFCPINASLLLLVAMAPLQLPPSFKFMFFCKPTFCRGWYTGSWQCFFHHYFWRCCIDSATSLICQLGSSVDFHPYVGETTPQAIVVVGDLVELSQLNKKKPKKLKWEINQIYQDQWVAFCLVCVYVCSKW